MLRIRSATLGTSQQGENGPIDALLRQVDLQKHPGRMFDQRRGIEQQRSTRPGWAALVACEPGHEGKACVNQRLFFAVQLRFLAGRLGHFTIHRRSIQYPAQQVFRPAEEVPVPHFAMKQVVDRRLTDSTIGRRQAPSW